MLRPKLLFLCFLFVGQFTFGQNLIYGEYNCNQVLFDSLRQTIHLQLKKDSKYIMQYSRAGSLITFSGKWWQEGDKIKLKSKYSKVDKSFGLERTTSLKIEGDNLIWMPSGNKRKLGKNKKKAEREISNTVGEKVKLKVIMTEPFILIKEH